MHFAYFLWVPNRNRLAVKNTRQAMLFVLIRFSGSACSGLLWFGGKGILTTFGPKGRD